MCQAHVAPKCAGWGLAAGKLKEVTETGGEQNGHCP